MLVERTEWMEVTDPRVEALAEGEVLRSGLGGREICWVRMNGSLHALADRCPHQGARLSEGWCADGLVVCPRHRYRFDPVTGRGRDGEGERAETFPLELRSGRIYVGFNRLKFRLFGRDIF